MTVAGELIALRRADVKALRARYLELTGKPLQANDREVAWRAVARVLQSLPTAEPPSEAPRPRSPRRATAERARPRAKARITPGTVIVRFWHGVEHRVTVVDGGFALKGQLFRSATALARHVTGQHWNGKLWLGLSKRGG